MRSRHMTCDKQNCQVFYHNGTTSFSSFTVLRRGCGVNFHTHYNGRTPFSFFFFLMGFETKAACKDSAEVTTFLPQLLTVSDTCSWPPWWGCSGWGCRSSRGRERRAWWPRRPPGSTRSPGSPCTASEREEEVGDEEVGDEEVAAVPGSDDLKEQKVLTSSHQKSFPVLKPLSFSLVSREKTTKSRPRRSSGSSSWWRRCFDFVLRDVQLNSNKKPRAAANSLSWLLKNIELLSLTYQRFSSSPR